MEKPLDGFNLPEKIGERIIDKPELPAQGVNTDSTVYTEIVVGEGQLKRGTIGKFEVFSDEAARIGRISTRLSLIVAVVLAAVLAALTPVVPALFTADPAVRSRLVAALLVLGSLPFFLGLMEHLAQRGFPAPMPFATHDHRTLSMLNGKPAAIVSCVPGRDLADVDATHCAKIGALLAEMHIAGQSYAVPMPNPRGTGWWTADAKGIWRPEGLNGPHEVSFGVHGDQYILNNPTYVASNWLTSPDQGNGTLSTFGAGKTETWGIWAQEKWNFAPGWTATLGGRLDMWRAYDGYNITGSTAVAQPPAEPPSTQPPAQLSEATPGTAPDPLPAAGPAEPPPPVPPAILRCAVSGAMATWLPVKRVSSARRGFDGNRPSPVSDCTPISSSTTGTPRRSQWKNFAPGVCPSRASTLEPVAFASLSAASSTVARWLSWNWAKLLARIA